MTDGLMARLEELSYRTLRDYLHGDHWRAFKTGYFDRNPLVTCMVCRGPAEELHHLGYRCLGRERDQDVAPLCRHHGRELNNVLRNRCWPLTKTLDGIGVLAAFRKKTEETRQRQLANHKKKKHKRPRV